MPRLVLFSDLDGTLLDHHSYSFDAAQEALDWLRAHQVPLVLASSKTTAEIASLHAALDLGDTPAIVENGAGIYHPSQPKPDESSVYAQIREALDDLPAPLRTAFRGFGDLGTEEITALTGLTAEQAADAANRQYSEPGLWNGTHEQQTAFLSALSEAGIKGRSGGRFLTLSFGTTKADGMRVLATELGADVTMALGDAPNDREMLDIADQAVVIRNDHGPDLPTLRNEASGRVLRTTLPGPSGWNAAVLSLGPQLLHGEQAR